MEHCSEIMALFVLDFINGDQFVQHICVYSRALYNGHQSCINRNHFFSDHVYYYGSYLLKERIGWMKLSGMFVCIAGILFLLSKGDFKNLLTLKFSLGDVWMLMAAFLFCGL